MKVFEIFKYFLYLGATCFGGPLALIANMRNDLVDNKKWVTQTEFENYFGYSQIAPGPIAFQVCLYIGYFMSGIAGAFWAGVGMVLPSYLVMLLFSVLYIEYGDTGYVVAALYGISPVIIAIIFQSGIKLSQTVFKKDVFLYILFFASIGVTIFLEFQIIYVIIASALVSLIYYVIKRKTELRGKAGSFFLHPLLFLLAKGKEFYAVLSLMLFSAGNKLLDLTYIFIKVGALTYGSGFVIVGVLKQEVVDNFGFLTLKQFVDGLAFGQITPGPVVITSTFIGYITSGIPGSLVSTVCIFLPTFVIVMLLARVINRVKDNFYLKALIKGANASAIGAILSTSYFLSKDALIDAYTVIIFAVSLILMWSVKTKSIYLILFAAIAGIILKVTGIV